MEDTCASTSDNKDSKGSRNGRNEMNGNRVNGNVLQFILFCLIGVSNTIISEGIYAVLIFFNMHYLPASFIGFSVSVLNAYFWNGRYVFKERKDRERRVWWKVLSKTYLAYCAGYVANVLLLAFWIDVIKISRFMTPLADFFQEKGYAGFDAVFLGSLIAEFINLLLTTPINFVVNKFWAFRQKKKQQ